MAKSKFEIGETEKHTLVVGWSIISKHLTIYLDGKKITDKLHLTPTPEEWQLEVGESEKHQVKISAGGFSHTKVVLDGKEVQKI